MPAFHGLTWLYRRGASLHSIIRVILPLWDIYVAFWRIFSSAARAWQLTTGYGCTRKNLEACDQGNNSKWNKMAFTFVNFMDQKWICKQPCWLSQLSFSTVSFKTIINWNSLYCVLCFIMIDCFLFILIIDWPDTLDYEWYIFSKQYCKRSSSCCLLALLAR